jgi:hypothetical protein
MRKFLRLITQLLEETDRHTPSGVVFVCGKNYVTFAELWVDKIIAVEGKGRDPTIT